MLCCCWYCPGPVVYVMQQAYDGASCCYCQPHCCMQRALLTQRSCCCTVAQIKGHVSNSCAVTNPYRSLSNRCSMVDGWFPLLAYCVAQSMLKVTLIWSGWITACFRTWSREPAERRLASPKSLTTREMYLTCHRQRLYDVASSAEPASACA